MSRASSSRDADCVDDTQFVRVALQRYLRGYREYICCEYECVQSCQANAIYTIYRKYMFVCARMYSCQFSCFSLLGAEPYPMCVKNQFNRAIRGGWRAPIRVARVIVNLYIFIYISPGANS